MPSIGSYQFEAGTLVDKDIIALARSGHLIIDGFEESCVRQACYELRASDIFWETASLEESKKKTVKNGEPYILAPKCYITVIVKEKISLPASMVARILAKGQLFALGILPVNTYADPGFEGRLGITLSNMSQRYIKIHPNEPIAKIEFTVLPKDVERPYKGQHGYETQIWPIRTDLYCDTSKLRVEGKIGTEEDEIGHSFGPELGNLAQRVRFYSRFVWIQLGITVLLFCGLFFLYNQLSLMESLLVGVGGNLLTMAIENPIRKVLLRRK
jgi:dCTP deaminase